MAGKLEASEKKLEESERKLKESEKKLEASGTKIEELEKEVERLNEIIRNFQRRKFKSESEKSGYILQLGLFNEAERTADDVSGAQAQEEEVSVKEHRRRKKGKGIDDSAVERITVHHERKTEEELRCPECGRQMRETKPTVIEKLEYHPGKWVMEKHIIHNYECPSCSDAGGNPLKVPAAEMPELIQGSVCTPGVMALIFLEKFAKAVPLYRLEKALKSAGVYLSRQVMSFWFLSVMEIYIMPLVEIMARDIKAAGIMYGDETTLKCISEEVPGNAYMWLQCTGPLSGRQIYIFTYHRGRDGEFCRQLYEGYSGYLHCDGYSAYAGLENVTVARCWDHARRRIVDALAADPAKEKYEKCPDREAEAEFLSSNRGFALKKELFGMVNRLYDLEREYRKKGMSPEEKKEAREKRSRPVTDEIRKFLDENTGKFPAKSKMGDAMQYLDNGWEGFLTFLEDGRLEISNARSERGIKNFVIGRKNFLFCDTPRGAEASAAAYSLMVTVKENGLKPYEYIKYILEEMMTMKNPSEEKYRELLPYSDKLPDYLRINKKSDD